MCKWLAGENAPCTDVAYQTLSVLTKPLAGQATQSCHSFFDLMYVTSPYPKLKPLVVAPHFPTCTFVRSSVLLNAAYRVLAYVSSRLSRIGPSNMLSACLVAILGMSFYAINPTPQIMTLAFSIPVTPARGKSRKRVRCIACSSHSCF